MKLIVCVKQVIDPEEPPSSFGVDESARKISLPPGVPSVVSPFDRQAVEAALRIKDDNGGKVTALSLGHDLSLPVLRDPLAMGADELILMDDPVFEDNDAWSTAYGLAMGAKKIGDFDIIFCGRQDSENDAGQIGTCIGKILNIPCVTVAKKIDVKEGKATIERVTDDGHEVLTVDLPVVVTVSNELGEARFATVKQTMKARKIKPVVWRHSDLDLTAEQVGVGDRKVKLVKMFKPVRDIHCEMIQGATPEEMGANLAVKLRDANLL